MNTGNTVLAIPVKDGIPIVHLFEIIDKGDTYREREEVGRKPEVGT